MKTKIIFSILVFIFGIVAGILSPFQCNRRAKLVEVDTIQVFVNSDTVYGAADSSWTDTVFINSVAGATRPRKKVNFIKDDSLIYIKGFTLTNPAYCSLSYYIKPINFDVYIYPDTLLTSEVEGFNVNISGSVRSLVRYKTGGFLYLGVARNFNNNRYIPEIGLGYSFGKIGLKFGVIDEFYTAGIQYYF